MLNLRASAIFMLSDILLFPPRKTATAVVHLKFDVAVGATVVQKASSPCAQRPRAEVLRSLLVAHGAGGPPHTRLQPHERRREKAREFSVILE